MLRLDKLLASSGFGSRSEVHKLLKNGTVTVDGQTVTDPACKVSPEQNDIAVNSAAVSYQKFLYFIMNKPSGVISATEGLDERTVIDLLPAQYQNKGLFPVGRLDKDTTGLLLITNDGRFAHNTLSPKKHVAKVYRAKVDGCLTEADVSAFAAGISLADFACMPAKLTILAENEALIEITEGKFHQVKRMFEAVGKRVTKLERVAFGPLSLPTELRAGEFRALTPAELALLSPWLST